jgi:putative peptide maturation dehydrogenase
MLMIERREREEFSMRSLLEGGDGLESRACWVALAPAVGAEVEVDLQDLACLEAFAPREWRERGELEERFGAARVAALLGSGLLIGEDEAQATLREREARLESTSWWTPAAVAQVFGSWRGVDVVADAPQDGSRSVAGMVERRGMPPPAAASYRDATTWLALPPPSLTPLDALLAARSTCRNFDAGASVRLEELASLLHRVFGAQAVAEPRQGVHMLKKNAPSGGGLHAIEAFVLAQRVDGLEPGLYHYECRAHALEPMSPAPDGGTRAAALELVAGQHWFADAPVLLVLAARFQRNFWKYREHAKAWKVLQLDAGHLSQLLYLSATELGHGAFITAAINDATAEGLFGLDGVSSGAIAVCGFGKRSGEQANIEFDPNGKAVR